MALKNLRTAFPGKDERWYNATIKTLYQFTVEEIVDFLSKYAHFDANTVHFNNMQVVDDALKENNGVILVGGHFGSFHKLIVTMQEKDIRILQEFRINKITKQLQSFLWN